MNIKIEQINIKIKVASDARQIASNEHEQQEKIVQIIRQEERDKNKALRKLKNRLWD
ncbi:hypothetical protein [Flammeovirga pacifica]|uniref:hypothetical protein n=1 Tax=Flammeovirga pacifica TaxID=915059 RepID=UPI00130179AD|nr:hypothetical protein [Flammeovirga pacifica]